MAKKAPEEKYSHQCIGNRARKEGGSNINPYGGPNSGGRSSSYYKGGNSCTDHGMRTTVVRHTIEKFVEGGRKEKLCLGSLTPNGEFTEDALAIITGENSICYMNVKDDANLQSIKRKINGALTEEAFIIKQEQACQKRGKGFVYLDMAKQEYSEYNDD